MEHLVLHPGTKKNVAQFVAGPSHALLLVGTNGVGKGSLAQTMLASILELTPKKLSQHPYFKVVQPVKDTLPIDAIRELQRFLQLKTLGTQSFRRAIIVEHAEAMTTEAQNAFLKLLEEPPSDTIMILTADSQRNLLPTILSRTQIIPVYAPDEEALKKYFSEASKATAAINQAYLLSGGLPGLMHALLEDDETHPLVEGVAVAKQILQKTTFERLALVETLSKQKDEARHVIDALQHIAQTMLDSAASKQDPTKLKQWHHILKSASRAKQALAGNANTKLVLDNLMLSL